MLQQESYLNNKNAKQVPGEITNVETDPSIFLVDLNSEGVLDVLDGEVLPDGAELANDVIVLSLSLVPEVDEMSQGLLEDIFGADDGGIRESGEAVVGFLDVLADALGRVR